MYINHYTRMVLIFWLIHATALRPVRSEQATWTRANVCHTLPLVGLS